MCIIDFHIEEGKMENVIIKQVEQPIVTELLESKICNYAALVIAEGGHVPFTTARQFSSIGSATSAFDSSRDRRDEYFSEHERKFGLVLSFLANVHQIKTQMPLLRRCPDEFLATLRIACELNVVHPRYRPEPNSVKPENRGYQAVVMTTDFVFNVICYDTGEINKVAVSIKDKANVDTERTDKRSVDRLKDKFSIEKAYWKEEHTESFLIDSSSPYFNATFIKNLEEAQRYKVIPIISPLIVAGIKYKLLECFGKTRCLTVAEAFLVTSKNAHVSIDLVHKVFWHLVWHKKLPVDYMKPLEAHNYLFKGGEKSWTW